MEATGRRNLREQVVEGRLDRIIIFDPQMLPVAPVQRYYLALGVLLVDGTARL